MARGNQRHEIYRDDRDRARFLELLDQIACEHAMTCDAYCLMPNHYHLVARFAGPLLSKMMQALNSAYGQWFNRKYYRVGHVFQGRFRAQVIEDDVYFLAACRYVVLNPLRAGLVTRADDWRWSSHRAMIGAAAPLKCQSRDLLKYFGGVNTGDGIARYLAFIAAPEATVYRLPAQLVLGEERSAARFRDRAAASSREIRRCDRLLPPPLASLFEGAFTRESRNRSMIEAVSLGYPVTVVARFLGVHYSSVSKVVRASSKVTEPSDPSARADSHPESEQANA
jgi:REP element-mobilizing transposase RayT